MIIFTLSWSEILQDLAKLVFAFLLAVPIGLNREREERSAGVRTFPIVALASCGVAIVATRLPHATPDSYSRIIQGLITGIGFVGAGAILKDRGGVHGTATAASVWNVGIIGAAAGLEMFHVAVVLALVNFLTLKYMKQQDAQFDRTVEGAFRSPREGPDQ
jgi:putative Mg2+ transporter-C (MgtC) family protein